jgi:hypothetical protein
MTSYPIRSVGVFCGSSDRVADVYHHAARKLGDQLAAAGWTTVYGGGGVGLMGTLARAALKRHGKVVGVRPRFITDLEGDQMGLTELIATDTMHERIAMIFEMSDAFVALPGSCGTLDEVVQAITWKRLALHDKPVAILDVGGFYRPLAQQFERMIEDEFIVSTYRDVSRFCMDVRAVMDYFRTYQPPQPMF